MRRPGVGKRIVNVRDRRGEFQPAGLCGNFARGGDELLAGVGLIQSGYDILIQPECQPLFQESCAGDVDRSRGEVNHLIGPEAQSKICCT